MKPASGALRLVSAAAIISVAGVVLAIGATAAGVPPDVIAVAWAIVVLLVIVLSTLAGVRYLESRAERRRGK